MARTYLQIGRMRSLKALVNGAKQHEGSVGVSGQPAGFDLLVIMTPENLEKIRRKWSTKGGWLVDSILLNSGKVLRMSKEKCTSSCS